MKTEPDTSVTSSDINRPVILATLILASMAAVMSTDMYAPSLAQLPALLGTSASAVQLTMSLNALAFGLAQLIHGPLSDRFGRRPVMLWGLALFSLFSLACGLSQNIEQLIAFRILQGSAAAVEAVLVLAIISDIYTPAQRAKAMALYGAIWAIAPAIAPVIGGYVHEWAGWHWNFVIIAIAGLLAWGLSLRFLRETGSPDHNALQPTRLMKNYWQLLKHRKFMGYSLLIALPLGALLSYITAAPFLLQNLFGMAVTEVGYYQAAMAVAYIFASIVVSKVADKIDHITLLKVGIALTLFGMLIVAFTILSDQLTPPLLLITMLIFATGFGPLFSVTPSLIMDASTAGKGTAAAMLGAVEMVSVGILVSLLSALEDGSPKPLAIVFCTAIIAILILCAMRPWKDSR